MWLSIDEKDNRPLYLQIINQVKEQVNKGIIKPGDELPSVRELADSLGINLHTVRSAYLKLRDQGIIDLRLGRRAKVARLHSMPEDADFKARLDQRIREIVTDAQLMGISPEEIHKLLGKQMNKREE